MTEKTDSPLRIWLVEDDEDDRIFFNEAVDEIKIPHEISCAKDCFEFFDMLDGSPVPDVIFLDINLPLMDGKECLKQIKVNEKYKNVPVIIFTGSSAQTDIDFVYEHGAHYHVVKPYAHINYLASLKMIFEVNWKENQARPSRDNFVVNLAFSN